MSQLVNKLSDVQIKQWMKAGKPVAVSDGGGLTFTLSASGTGAWILRYRYGGRLKELTLGRYPDKSLADAREDARQARSKVQSGVDVARKKQLDRIRLAKQKTFRELANDYMVKVYPTLANTTVKQRNQQFKKWILPKLGSVLAREVETADIVSLVASVGKKSINVAEMVLTVVSETFKHGIAQHTVTANPCLGISVAAICGRPAPTRQRLMLTEEELRTVLPRLSFVGPDNALAVKILLATCPRIGELARAKWEDIDFSQSVWHVTTANSKTGKGYTIPLTPVVAEWFRELETLACGSTYVLPARQKRRAKNHEGDTYFEQRALNSMLHKLFDSMETSGISIRRFTPHDLRSTARSWLTSDQIGAEVHIAERCLNHAIGGIAAVYDKHDYLTERREVLEKWTRILLALETGKLLETVAT
nr:site-specific integrase [Rhodoferax sp.]